MSDLRESQEYKECLQLLSFLSKKEFLEKLNSFTTIMESSKDSIMKKVKVDLQDRIKTIEEASLEVASKPVDIVSTGEKLSRLQLKEVWNKIQRFSADACILEKQENYNILLCVPL